MLHRAICEIQAISRTINVDQTMDTTRALPSHNEDVPPGDQASAICKTAADGTCARPTKWSPGSGFVARWTG